MEARYQLRQCPGDLTTLAEPLSQTKTGLGVIPSGRWIVRLVVRKDRQWQGS